MRTVAVTFHWIARCLVALLLGGCMASAADRYVDSSLPYGGTHDGTSWATAWTNVTKVAGVSAGDIVHISGGASGSSQSYSVSGWIPSGGVFGNPITYQIAQDSAHNGTAIFIGSGGNWAGAAHDVYISGQVTNDPNQHFWCSNYSEALGSSGTTIYDDHISYVNFNTNSGANCMELWHGYSNEVDHFTVMMTAAAGDVTFWTPSAGGAAAYGTSLLFHNNTLYLPGGGGAGFEDDGIDGLQFGGTGGFSIYNNRFFCQRDSGNNIVSLQHQDCVQGWGASYTLVYNNYFYGSAQTAVYFDNEAVGAAESHFYMFNNVVDSCQRGALNGPDSTCSSLTAESCINNVYVNCNYNSYGYGILMNNASGNSTTTWSDCWAMNNVTYQNFGGNSFISQVTTLDNPNLSGSSSFMSYTTGSTNNDFHLTAAATTLIASGTNLTAFISTHPGTEMLAYDADGNPRPTTGNWDIGPYNYANGGQSSANTSFGGAILGGYKQ